MAGQFLLDEGKWLSDPKEQDAAKLKRAHDLFARACDVAHAQQAKSCRLVGRFHQEGRGGISKDGAKALSNHEKACKVDPKHGCHEAGLLLAWGELVAQDLTKAESFFDKACDAGEKAACRNLAEIRQGQWSVYWTTIEDLVVSSAKLDGKFVCMKKVKVLRTTLVDGFVSALDAPVIADGIDLEVRDDEAGEDAKRAFLKLRPKEATEVHKLCARFRMDRSRPRLRLGGLVVDEPEPLLAPK